MPSPVKSSPASSKDDWILQEINNIIQTLIDRVLLEHAGPVLCDAEPEEKKTEAS